MVKKIVDYSPEAIKGVYDICNGDLYVKNKKSLKPLLSHLKDAGYKVKDTSSDKCFDGKKPPRKVQEKEGSSLWHGSLTERVLKRKGECGSCHKLMDLRKAWKEGHKCGKCGDVTYKKFPDGSRINFNVVNYDNETVGSVMRDLTLIVHSYDDKKKRLNLYADHKDYKGKPREFSMRGLRKPVEDSYDDLSTMIKLYPKTFSVGKVKKTKVVSVPYDIKDSYLKEHGINTCERSGELKNFDQVKVFKGKKMDEWAQLPIPDSVSIYEAWHWAPLKPSPGLYQEIMHAAGQPPRKDYYHQDGRPAFSDCIIGRMLKFVEHFTTVDEKMVARHLDARLSGPGLIDVLAKITGHTKFIETAPNPMGALSIVAKALSGKRLTENELVQGEKSLIADMEGDNVVGETLGAYLYQERAKKLRKRKKRR
ncbi:hypothetical protein ACFLZZ_00820 [Nanoarchaeota archaeon]